MAPLIEEDAIIFAQGPDLDMAYDGDVVHHEYTHAVVGGDRLWGSARTPTAPTPRPCP